jgi:hypothetical protein
MADSSAPEIIYHYTTADGLLGILKGSSLWCTHFSYLNDAAEATYARRVFCDALEATPKDSPRRLIAEAVLARLEPLLTRGDAWTSLFTASFSEVEDDLSQWRAYSAAGARYAIGFDRARLEAAGEALGFKLRRICYKKETAFERLNPFIEELFTKIPALPPTGHVGILTIVPIMGKALEAEGPWLKHAKFEAEKEWRLATTTYTQDQVALRPGKSYLIPYIALPFDPKELIKEIWVGPGPHPRENELAVAHLLAKTTWERHRAPPPIRVSEIPFRDW